MWLGYLLPDSHRNEIQKERENGRHGVFDMTQNERDELKRLIKGGYVADNNSVIDLLAENQRMRELLEAVLQTGCEAGTGDDIESFLAEHP